MHPSSFKGYIGCSGWSYGDWKGLFYPSNLSSKNYFSYYAQFFDTVEINSTFYRFPTEKALKSWYEQAPKAFKYSLKASRIITHIKRFKGAKEALKRFYGISDILAEKTGCFLFQFPENYTFSNERLERVLVELDPTYKNVIEFRDSSWWTPDIIQAFSKEKVIFCSVSGFNLPDHLIATNKMSYIRFHGSPAYASLYSDEGLARWVKKIKAASLQELWAYFNNDFQAYAVHNAVNLKNSLSNQ